MIGSVGKLGFGFLFNLMFSGVINRVKKIFRKLFGIPEPPSTMEKLGSAVGSTASTVGNIATFGLFKKKEEEQDSKSSSWGIFGKSKEEKKENEDKNSSWGIFGNSKNVEESDKKAVVSKTWFT